MLQLVDSVKGDLAGHTMRKSVEGKLYGTAMRKASKVELCENKHCVAAFKFVEAELDGTCSV